MKTLAWLIIVVLSVELVGAVYLRRWPDALLVVAVIGVWAMALKKEDRR